MQSTRKPLVCHRGSVVHVHTDHNEHRIVLLCAALARRHRSPLAQLETPSALRWPASTHHPPSPVYRAWAGWLLHGQPRIKKDSRPLRYDFLPRSNSLGLSGSQTPSAVVGNGTVDHGPAVDAFPRIEHQKEIREPL